MRGTEIILLGIYSAIRNGTHYNNGVPFEVDGKINVENLNVSLSDWYAVRDMSMPSEIKVSTWQNMPYSGLKRNNQGGYEGTGYAFELLKLIQSKLNFTYTIIPPRPYVLGNKNRGLMELLHNRDIDLAAAFIPVLPHLQNICSFTGPVDDVEITFLMKRPRESAIGSGLLAPFNKTVWLCILAALIIVGPVIYILIHIRSRISSRGHPEGYPLSTCIWFTYGALLKQGSTVSPVTDSTRMLFATWWIFITILTSFYTANLTAFLTLSEFTLPFSTIEDITKKHQKWITFADNSVDNSINMTDQNDLKLLRTSLKMKEGSYIQSHNDGNKVTDFNSIKRAVNTGPLFIGEKYFIEDLIFNNYRTKTLEQIDEPDRCTLVMLPDNLYVNNRAFAFPKHSPIQEHIEKHLRNLVETGIVKHLKQEAVPTVKYCPLNLKSRERCLRNADLTMTYYCIGAGFAVATLTFFGELVHKLVQLRKGVSCGECCSRLCCRSKVKSAELPIYKHELEPGFLKQFTPPIYESPYDRQMVPKYVINGRDYWVIKEEDGDQRLVPVRSPSAVLFQYTSYFEGSSSNDIRKF